MGHTAGSASEGAAFTLCSAAVPRKSPGDGKCPLTFLPRHLLQTTGGDACHQAGTRTQWVTASSYHVRPSPREQLQ